MLRTKFLNKLDERRVRYLLGAFFLALAIPAVVLIGQAYSQLKWEAFRRNQLLAEEFAVRIDTDLRAAVAIEEGRSFGDYSFLVVEGDAAANFVQRSPLSTFPVTGAVPGVLGYFQVDAAGRLTTPLLPEQGIDAAMYGIPVEEESARRALVATIRDVLAQNRLVPRAAREAAAVEAEERPALAGIAAPQDAESRANLVEPDASPPPMQLAIAPAEPAQAGFDRLAQNSQSLARREVSDASTRNAVAGTEQVAAGASNADSARASSPAPAGFASAFAERQKRTEQALVPEPTTAAAVDGTEPAQAAAAVDTAAPVPAPAPPAAPAAKVEFRVRTFESELDPFEVGVLDTGHLVMFRNVWRDGQRIVQGALIDRERFVARAVEDAFRVSSLAGMSDLSVAYQGRTLTALRAPAGSAYSSAELAGSLLQRARLSPPFGDLELVFNVNQLPRAAGSVLLAWVSVVLAAVLCGGFLFMYRFAVGQIRLTRQQQDFVSAVSHELKTPLTSIRMYGEMLKAGWADDAKKQTYYEYIHSESERLSRLIENVLQLARLTRSTQRFDMKRVTVAELIDIVRSKASAQVERAGFALEVRNEVPAGADVLLDPDCFTQIVINLVDNALKFSIGADRKIIEIVARRESAGQLLFTVRDFGPGIAKGQLKKIFELFYRPQSELTRETAGTGIGLALVRELAAAMGGRVDVRNCEPGAEFRLAFPA